MEGFNLRLHQDSMNEQRACGDDLKGRIASLEKYSLTSAETGAMVF